MILNIFQSLAQSLDLISEDIQVAQMWIQALSHIIQATKSVELQKEHESYLRSQFQAADVTKDGYLLLDEFAGKALKLHKAVIYDSTWGPIIHFFDGRSPSRHK